MNKLCDEHVTISYINFDNFNIKSMSDIGTQIEPFGLYYNCEL